ncbi:MBL fold metallo-hydrolase [Archangium sp.]|uniref:MBL fold metallo-hydrolase n=1 Tax=Archangium sp. TaxID=1872627 RepID=UPI002D51F8ED|nr:MBL fold metallo-hydrolase [Archangium sp.]HYO54373.1 MBL fold metallo-hydrolase [Archangium sp.]
MSRKCSLAILAWAVAVLPACATARWPYLHELEGTQKFMARQAQGDSVQVTYLGAAGYVIRRGEDAIMFAPSFTNPGIWALLTRPIQTDGRKVDACMKKAGVQAGDVSWLMVGHSHYDHLMDVPYVWQSYTPRARILGSQTTRHILASFKEIPEDHVRPIEESEVAKDGQMGKWIPDKKESPSVRVLAIKSDHAAHVLGIHLISRGKYTEARKEQPRSGLSDWKEGETYAYLVDFLNPDGSIDFRIHFQDAASSAEWGRLPEEVKREYPRVDLSIACTGGYEQARGYPETILSQTRPRHVILGHWEHFLGNDCAVDEQELLITLGRGGLRKFTHQVMSTVQDAEMILPMPLATMYIPNP